MSTGAVRVRFAPSPTGFMHIGNVSSALLNYLFARQKKGTFILRIEDTDAQRNLDPLGKHIIQDLLWLKLTYDEGPEVGGPYTPYIQSQRMPIYQTHLEKLNEKKAIYRCFCTVEELEKKRKRQIALKLPPRYDRTCLNVSPAEVEIKLINKIPFIWRFKLPDEQVTIHDLARGNITYDLKHFADFPLTRQDGSFTFIFANFVDDLTMHITHIFRGEDHLSNTALQAALYNTFQAPIPIFWHLPLICNKDGKKLSKRDFGFSLNDLRAAGFLPEAINNYLALLGGGTFENEIMSLEELTKALNFEKIAASSGHIKYDIERLRWINHKWIVRLDIPDLMERCLPFLEKEYVQIQDMPKPKLAHLIELLRTDFVTLADCVASLAFYFKTPLITPELLITYQFETHKEALQAIQNILETHQAAENWTSLIIQYCKTHKIATKDIFTLMRIALIGSPQGPGMKEIIEILQTDEVLKRLKNLLSLA
ncbi:MAG: glutamate--tRNA ligase [Candidatus Babeliaceae bacterium]